MDCVCCFSALIDGIEPRETCPDTATAVINPFVNERGTVESGPHDHLVCPRKDKSRFMIIDAVDVD
jgi:hypothetical protein